MTYDITVHSNDEDLEIPIIGGVAEYTFHMDKEFGLMPAGNELYYYEFHFPDASSASYFLRMMPVEPKTLLG